MICKVLLPLRKRPPSEQENGQKLGKKKKLPGREIQMTLNKGT